MQTAVLLTLAVWAAFDGPGTGTARVGSGESWNHATAVRARIGSERTERAADRPNIVLILADDLGIGDVKCYGGQRCQIETPHIDALAQSGLRFTDAHPSASVCVPTRVAIMTGRYPWRFGPPAPGGPWGFLGTRFPPSTPTLGSLLGSAGYHTGYIGKWHLGTLMTTIDDKPQNATNVDYNRPVRTGPAQYGFNESFILPGSLDMYPYAFLRNNVWQGDVTAQKGWSAFNRVGPAAVDFEDHEVLETFYRESDAFIARQRKEEPFFLYLALTAPHTPTSPGRKFQGRSRLGLYGDFVMEVDHAVERVVTALERSRLRENTLILFSSDHGPGPYAGNIRKATPGQIRLLEKAGHYPGGPHRGYKFSVWEGGLRCPLIASWPGVVPAGSECQALVGLNDLMATCAEIAGAEIGESTAPDSISFASSLREPSAAGKRTHLIMQSVGPFVVRDGDWKLCLCPGSGSPLEYGNTPRLDVAWKQAIEDFGRMPARDELTQSPFVQLYHVASDLHEDHDLAAKHPERVRSMVKLLRSQIDSGRSTPGPKLTNERRRIDVMQRLPEFVRKQLAP